MDRDELLANLKAAHEELTGYADNTPVRHIVCENLGWAEKVEVARLLTSEFNYVADPDSLFECMSEETAVRQLSQLIESLENGETE